jgi:hypothetical protein
MVKAVKRIEPEGFAETPQEWLETVVSAGTARDIIEHRRAKKCPLTARAAKAIAMELGQVPQHMREAAIDHWLNMGWQGFKADWFMRSDRARGVIGAAIGMIENGRQNTRNPFDDVERLPAVSKH